MKKLFLLIITLLLITPLAFADVLYTDGFEDGDYTNDPTWSVIDTSGGSVAVTTDVPYAGSYSLKATTDGADDNAWIKYDTAINTSSFAVGQQYSGWFRTTDAPASRADYMIKSSSGTTFASIFFFETGGIHYSVSGGAGNAQLIANPLNNVWYNFTIIYQGNTADFYIYSVNGTEVASATGISDGTTDFSTFAEIEIRARDSSAISYNVYYDNVGYKYAPAVAPPPTASYSTITVYDSYDNSTISGLTVYIGSGSNTTDGSGIATVYNPTGLNYTVDGGSNYFNTSGTGIENATVQAYTYGALPDLSAYNVEGTNLLIFNLTSPETFNSTIDGSAPLLLPPANTTEITTRSLNYYDLLINITTTGKDTDAQNITGMYQTIVTINATNAYTGAKLYNFTGWMYNNDTGFNTSFNDSGTGNVTVFALNGVHIIYVNVDNYSISDANFDTSNYTTTTYNKTFSLYSNNSILINIRNEETNIIITDNVTVTVSGSLIEDVYYTTTGSLFIDNLTDGNYTIKFEASNYTLRTYSVTVADSSTQVLNAFLSPSTDTVTFAIIDFDNSQAIEGASIIQQRIINGTLTTVESKLSDITGRAQFTYTTGVKYTFTVSKTGFSSKVFELDPVIFTSYFIRLERDLELDTNTGLFDVTITYYPEVFINEENNSFTITFGSVGGSLESYGYNIVYPGGSQAGTGLNANGGTFTNGSFLITGATFTDRFVLTYWYKSVYGANKTYTREYIINGATETGTLYDFNNEDYGLGTVEKILIAVVCSFMVAGVLSLFGSPVIGLVGGLLTLGLFTVIGFLSIWVTLPTFVVGFLLLSRRSSE